MAEWLRIGANIATPIGLIGFAIGIAIIAYIWRLKSGLKQLELLPQENRAHAIDETLKRYNLDGGNLTRDQKVGLIRDEMYLRQSRFWGFLIAAIVLVLASLLVVAASYLYQPELPPQAVTARVQFGGNPIKRPFKLTFLDESGRRYEVKGKDGVGTMEVPGSVRILKNANIEMPCYKRRDTGTIDLVQGQEILIELERVPTKMPDQPFVPSKLPNLMTLIPPNHLPKVHQLSASPSLLNPGEAVLEVENNTEGLIRLLLHSFDPKRANPLRVIMCDHCDPKPYNKFTEKIGWFAFFAQTEKGDVHYLGCEDVYKQPRTKLVLEKRDDKIVGTFPR